jgi:endoglucanase
MRRIFLFLLAFFSFLLLTCTTTADIKTYPAVDGRLDPFKQVQLLKKTVNLGNFLECPPPEGSWQQGRTIEEYFFKLIKQKGFTAVRIPVRFSAYTDRNSPYSVSEVFFERVDQVTGWTLKYGLAVIIDLHHFEELHRNPRKQKARFLAIWRQIAERYKDCPDTVFFEILNEPTSNLTPALWNEFLYECLVEIREIDNHHTVIIGCARWSDVQGLEYLIVPEQETNAIVTFHYYHPFLFTHQGAPWGGADVATTGIEFPGPSVEPVVPAAGVGRWVEDWIDRYNQVADPELNPCGYKLIRDEIDYAARWGETHKRPLFMGEFGVVPYADMQSRVNWTAYVREQLEAKGEWVEELVEALGL